MKPASASHRKRIEPPPRHLARTPPGPVTILAFEKVTLCRDGVAAFAHTDWTWRKGEQWGILGRDDSGTSLLVEAILGRTPLTEGDVRGPASVENSALLTPSPSSVLVSPQTQRDLALQESAFYQERWHSGLDHGPRTVADYLSQDSVEGHNPFEIGRRRGSRSSFLRRRRAFIRALDIRHLLRRRLVHLSNGEMRRTHLVHALLQAPWLLILENPFSGLDQATRTRLQRIIVQLMRDDWPILIVTHRPEDFPPTTTHVLLVHKHRVIAQGPKRPLLSYWSRKWGVRTSSSPKIAAGRPGSSRHRTPSTPAQPLFELRGVTVQGQGRNLLENITWSVFPGQRWALLGPNGAGKTTLLNLIQGDHPQAYALNIRLFGRPTDSTSALWRARQQIGWMSPELHQHYPPDWQVVDVIASGFFNTVGLYQPATPRQRAAVRLWLRRLDLVRHAHARFGELGYGQQRLVLFARAVVKRPRLLILDEPCQGLDHVQRSTMLSTVDATVCRQGLSLIFVTHHRDELPRCITHRLRLGAGCIREITSIL